ncbi:MAG TPA: type II toxin-antitoxin system prevent-host-death family antitoxin [Solirubrobacteraceae bacterium]|nr:type II toxin-antitoxin system prevent-host-death family antitoxin [Solirubrobacteraceae bacterium]
MAEIGIRALKQNASAVVARAAAGEILTITDHGTPVARLMPIAKTRLDELEAAGLLSRPHGSLDTLDPPVELAGRQSLSSTLAGMRDEDDR